jgi:SAM-dependent methyltransferase
LQGNFLELPAELDHTVDFAFAIEAFMHSPDAGGFFREAARALKPGGRLLVCDDFLGSTEERSPRERRWLEDFRRGWRVGSLVSPEEAQSLAQAVSLRLVRDVDLNPYLELGRPRDRMIDAVVAVGRWLPIDGEYWRMLVGGSALQRALAAGAIHYRILVFERRDAG